MNPRLLLIGGSSGAGKTTVARRLATSLGAGWLQVDTIWIALRAAAQPGTPEHAAFDIDRRIKSGEEPADMLVAAHLLACELVCRTLPDVLAFELRTHRTVVADGAWLTPPFMASFRPEQVDVSAVVIHEPEQAEVLRAMRTRSPFPSTMPWQRRGAEVSWRLGDRLASQARELGVPVVPARPRSELLERASAVLGVGGGQQC